MSGSAAILTVAVQRNQITIDNMPTNQLAKHATHVLHVAALPAWLPARGMWHLGQIIQPETVCRLITYMDSKLL